MCKSIVGTSQLLRSQNIYPQILATFKIKNLATSNCVASAVIPCDGTVEIGRLDAVNPPHALVCKYIWHPN